MHSNSVVLPGAVRADQPEHFSLAHRQRHVGHRGQPAVRLRQAVDARHQGRRHPGSKKSIGGDLLLPDVVENRRESRESGDRVIGSDLRKSADDGFHDLVEGRGGGDDEGGEAEGAGRDHHAAERRRDAAGCRPGLDEAADAGFDAAAEVEGAGQFGRAGRGARRATRIRACASSSATPGSPPATRGASAASSAALAQARSRRAVAAQHVGTRADQEALEVVAYA